MPGHFHGWAGLLGIALMTYLWRLGRKTSTEKKAGKSFAKSKQLHGKLSDIMIGLIAIHAFLGFLYLAINRLTICPHFQPFSDIFVDISADHFPLNPLTIF